MSPPATRRSILVPELGMGQRPLRLCVWLVATGTRVAAGDRVVEILTGDAVVDLPAPASGVLIEKCVAEETQVQVGQVLGWIALRPEDVDLP